MSHYLGIDIGGTKIAGVVLNDEQQVVSQHQIETPREDYAVFLNNLVNFIQDLDGGLGLPVGVGMPGALSLEDDRVKSPCARMTMEVTSWPALAVGSLLSFGVHLFSHSFFFYSYRNF